MNDSHGRVSTPYPSGIVEFGAMVGNAHPTSEGRNNRSRMNDSHGRVSTPYPSGIVEFGAMVGNARPTSEWVGRNNRRALRRISRDKSQNKQERV
ncbi:MAG: hypothetical protein RRB22_13420, partial [Gammaproteobacteria bacterium]|nr:hypothetical protein [Gammaproteobacteria bacterium]